MRTYKVQVFKSLLVRDGSVKLTLPGVGELIYNSADCAKLFHIYLKNVDVEHFVALWLDQKNRIIGLRTVSTGSLTGSLVHPREVFLGTSEGRVASIVLAHNHPSGNTQPSQLDLATTQRLVQAGKILGIPVVDHIIVGFDYNGDPLPYFSFVDNDLIANERIA